VYCAHCGRCVGDDDAFCRSCGAAQKAVATPAPATPTTSPTTPQPQLQERFFLEDVSGVSVTNTRLIYRGKTYALANVSSVSLERRNPHSKAGLVFLLAGIAVVFLNGPGSNWGAVGFGALLSLVGAGLRLMRNFVVRLRTAGGESDGLTTGNRRVAERVVQAIEQAIVARG
jgi:hypothetical protein